MKLPFALPFGKKEEKDFILGLLLRDEKVTAVVFEEKDGTVRIVNKQEEYLPELLETISIEHLLDSLDKAVSNAESVLPANIETKKVIFGVKENWVNDTQMKKEYLAKLKKISEDFGLTPLGFLVIHEALAHFLKVKEGVPVSAILLEAGQKTIAISILRGGRIIETKSGAIEDSLSKATDRLLHHFTNYEVLPSRVIIFDGMTYGKDYDRVSQEFIAYSWSKSLPFLHVPQITILPKYTDAHAMLFGAASQLGLAVAESTNGLPMQKTTLEKSDDFSPLTKKASFVDFGFVKGVDVALPSPPFEKRPLEELEPQQETPDKKSPPLLKEAVGLIVSLPRIFFAVRKMLQIDGRFFAKKSAMIGVVFAALLIALVLGYFFGIKATVTLSAKPKIVEQEQAVVLATNSKSDVGKKVIAATQITVEQTASATTKATGKKEVGEKAKGAVTILSSLPNEQTLNAGTIITSPNILEFTLDEAVKIASSSGLSDLKSAKVSITAKDIGKEYNLPSNTKFTVGSFDASQVEAKNEAAFSGGSKKEVTVVTKEDYALLAENIVKENKEKAKEELVKKIAADETLLPLPITSTLEKEEYSKKVDEETESVTLKATITYIGVSYKKEDLKKIAIALFTTAQQDTTFSQNTITTDIKDVKQKNKNESSAQVLAKASFLPKIDTTKVQKEIAGKPFDKVKADLMRLPQISDATIALSPPIPFLPKLLPRIANNIAIEIQNEEE